jgi:hypothetical protein
MENLFHPRSISLRKQLIGITTAVALVGLSGCSSGVAPSKTASGAGTGAVLGGIGGAVVGNNSSMGTGTGLAAGAVGGALIGGIVGMVQDAKDRREQDRLAQERAYQQELAKKRAEEAKLKAAMDEELAVAEGFRISDMELNDAKKKRDETLDRLKKLQNERSAALNRKKELDEAHEKTIQTEAQIAALEEELARLKGDDATQKKPDAAPAQTQPSAAVKPGL